MRILVTGGAGYIGAITTRHLLDHGHDVIVLDSLVRGVRRAVDERADFVRASVGDAVALEEVLPGCDAVMHMAGLIEVAESQREPGAYFDANVAEPVRMLEAMVRHGVDSIVFSSTAAVYGDLKRMPIVEDAPTHPVNFYGASKLMFERMLDWYGCAHGLRSVRLRYFNVAGAWPDGSLGEAHDPETHIIPRILEAMKGGQSRFEVYGDDYPTADGTCVRDYIHVCDLAQAHLLGLEWLSDEGADWSGLAEPRSVTEGPGDGSAEKHIFESPPTRVFNLGSGRGYSNLEVLRVCAEVTGVEIDLVVGPRRPGDPAVLVASADRAREVLGWESRPGGLNEMVADAWRWHTL